MGKITEYELRNKLEEFAEALGLTYYPCTNRFSGTLDEEFVPEIKEHKDSITTEVTQDTKTEYRSTKPKYIPGLYGPSYMNVPSDPHQVATLLGKVNAIAEFLGLEFEVTPEKVVAEKVKATKKKGKK
jgi:hypothetical protein